MFISQLQRHVSAYNNGHRQVVYETFFNTYALN